ncbi:MAG TPA: acyl-CoA thioesterase [Cyclobacteriaceae bacterium]|nr:acyl-CoA thioesterase [Cyclobacteriaceae bacterium]
MTKDFTSARPVRFSQVTITELMIPAYANFGGKIHGGILLSLMDKVAYAAASKHSGAYCVTVSVDTVDFLQPVEVGELVSLKASVNYVGNSSMVIGIKVISENVKTGSLNHTNTCYFTMVAKGEDDKPTTVPPLILESPIEVRRFVEAIYRTKFKQNYKANLREIKKNWEKQDLEALLSKERCFYTSNPADSITPVEAPL